MMTDTKRRDPDPWSGEDTTPDVPAHDYAEDAESILQHRGNDTDANPRALLAIFWQLRAIADSLDSISTTLDRIAPTTGRRDEPHA